jgi:outer membrane protein OmpA-like peptidoglycan-associated protein
MPSELHTSGSRRSPFSEASLERTSSDPPGDLPPRPGCVRLLVRCTKDWRWVWATLFTLAAAGCPRATRAQDESGDPREPVPLRARASFGMSTMVSRDQTGWLGYDTLGALTTAQVGYAWQPWLETQLSVTFAAFRSEARGTGQLIAPTVGVLIGSASKTLRPYAQLDVGPGFSGSLLRMYLRVSAGVDFRISQGLTLGPQIGYSQLFQSDEPGNSTDARFPWLGVSLSFRPAPDAHSSALTRTQTRFRDVYVYTHAPAAREEPEAAREVRPPSRALIELVDRAVGVEREELLAPVLFRFDSAELEPEGVAMLHEVARELTRRSDIVQLEIHGYADRRGPPEYNRALSWRRAERVRAWLVAHGIAADRIQVAAKGATDFVEAGDGETEHAQNRRVVFRVLKTEQEAVK